MSQSYDDMGSMSLLALFSLEVQTQAQVLTEGLLAFELGNGTPATLESLMRAAHSLKGAAAIVQLAPMVKLAHVMEDAFVAAQQGRLSLDSPSVDALFGGVDLMMRLTAAPDGDTDAWLARHRADMETAQQRIAALCNRTHAATPAIAAAPVTATGPLPVEASPMPAVAASGSEIAPAPAAPPAQANDELFALAGQSRLLAHQLQPWIASLHRFKRQQASLFDALEDLNEAIAATGDARLIGRAQRAIARARPLKDSLRQRISEADHYERRATSIASRMMDEVLTLRMGRFAERIQSFPRMVRDLARDLGKDARLQVLGEDTLVDRSTLARLEAPLTQMLRNAVDHGLEDPGARVAAGKPAQGTVTLAARHRAGMLQIEVSDDGRGIDPEAVRAAVVRRGLASATVARDLGSDELMSFLFLPGFSMKDGTSEVSGRGVGLDVVHDVVNTQHGDVHVESIPGQGTHVVLTLPLTQSIVRALIADVDGEAYALPIARVARVLRLPRAEVRTVAGGAAVLHEGEPLALVSATQVLGLGPARTEGDLTVVILGAGRERYAVAVDAVRGEQSLTVQPLEPIFGKLRDVAAGALLDDGSPVLILDVADVLQSIGKLLGAGALDAVAQAVAQPTAARRVLVVDDSLTVREMQRKLLSAHGYQVDVAVDGMDGWNMLRTGDYDLLITDVDMPRMDGIELVQAVRGEARLARLPVMIVSYKDRPEDRSRGLLAGADHYLAKGNFHDTALLDAVHDLIGSPS